MIPRRVICRWALLGVAIAACCWCAPAVHGAAVLLVIDGASPNTSEAARKTQFETWGHTVATIQDSASQASFDAAMAAASVVYIPMTVTDWEITNKAKNTTKGVVCEERYIDDDMGFSTGTGWNNNLTQTEILSNSHVVTTGLSTGYVTIVSSTQELAMLNPTIASGMTILSKQNYTEGNMLGVIDVGGALAGGGTAAGRRVRMPWGGDGFSWSALNANGLLIAQQAIAWAVGDTLQLHLKLDETSGTTAADSSTSARNGTVTGTSTWIAGRRRNGFDFDGSTKIEVNSLLGNPTNFTMVCWARIDATDTSGADGISVGDYLRLRLHNVSGAVPSGEFYAGGSTWGTVSGTKSYIGLGWRHFAVTFDDAANTLKLYIDGALVATTTTTLSITWSGLGTKTRIGTHGNTSTAYDLDGAVDDARIYSRALTQSEIIEIYGLVGHWKLDETSGSAVSDSSGLSNSGAVTGTSQWTTGARDNGQRFQYQNGDDYIAVTNSSSLQDVQEDDYSIAMWFKPMSVPPGAGFANDAIYAMATKSAAFMGLSYASGQIFGLSHAFADGSFSQLWSTTSAPAQKFHHVVAVINRGSGTSSLYLNGVLDASTTFTANKAAYEQGATPWRIGVCAPGAGSYKFAADGVADDVRVYNRAISASEVSELYGLLGHWKFDEGSGTAVADSSPMGAHAAFGSGTPVWTTGPRLRALQFNGTTDDAQTNASFAPPTEGTVAYWFRSNGPNAAQQRMFGNGGDWEARLTSDGILYLDLCGDAFNGGFFSTIPLATSGSWYHIAAVYDCDDEKYSLYLNGELHKSGTSAVALNPQSAQRLAFGARFGATERFSGAMDDFRIYDRKLSQAEIYDIYGLSAWYKLDETSGTIAADATGQLRDGVYFGNPTLNVASNGNVAKLVTAVDFSGTNNVQITGLYDQSSSVSAMAWARLDASDPSGAEIVSLGDHFMLRLTNTNVVGYYYNGSTWIGVFYSQAIVQTGWHHYAVVLDSIGAFKLYMDGNEVASTTLSGAISYAGLGQNSRIATHGNGSSSYDFDGRIDDVRIFNRAAQPSEVYDIYRGTRINGLKILKWVETR